MPETKKSRTTFFQNLIQSTRSENIPFVMFLRFYTSHILYDSYSHGREIRKTFIKHNNDINQTVISREHIEAVSDKLTSEKLASIKTKIRTRKRGTIADTDIIHGTFSFLFLNDFDKKIHNFL